RAEAAGPREDTVYLEICLVLDCTNFRSTPVFGSPVSRHSPSARQIATKLLTGSGKRSKLSPSPVSAVFLLLLYFCVFFDGELCSVQQSCIENYATKVVKTRL
ncbi:hypothetical protein BaRGS_00001155, partial [Batillaria attramentaria]